MSLLHGSLLINGEPPKTMKKKRRSRAKVRRLRFHGPDGKPRQRPKTVENDIADMLPLPHSERAAKAPVALNETLVYFIKRGDNKSGLYHDAFVAEIDTRLVNLADRYVRRLPQVTAEDIVTKVQGEFLQLILEEPASATTEFLEVAFALAVKKRTLQLVNLYLASPWSQRGYAAAERDDAEITERELQRIPDDGLGPEGALLHKEDQALCKERCEQALAAITDPVDQEIATLHWLEGFPIVSRVRGERDLVTRYRTTRGRIEWRLQRGMKQMRAALAVGVTQ